MPVQTSSRSHAAHMPSFMSVFGEESNNTRGMPEYSERNVPVAHNHLLKRPATSSSVLYNPNTTFTGFHQHRGSTSTSASESTDSSPTTTISTMDGSSLTEPSPGPSPASPAAKASPSSFSPDFRSRSTIGDKSKAGAADAHFFELQRPTTPAKKPRNLKGLAVNTASTLSLGGRTATTAALPVQNPPPSSSAPSSPSFVKPPTPPRRRPSNLALTLQTGGNGALPTLSIPPTPSIKRPNTLRHFQSSPSLPLCSPAIPPAGGMELPPPSRPKPQPHGFAEVPMEDEEEEQEPNFDVPQSREEKPEAYPNGPICIYESGVDLYYEPTADIAARYDVVLNVASEVVNPFKKAAQDAKRDAKAVSKENPTPPRTSELTQPSDRTSAGGSVAQATSENSAEAQGSSPTTPKATPSFGDRVEKRSSSSTSYSKPEYIHIPWEHNTDIVPDLYTLVRVIDDRVQQGKRILVHCQCGVSRSASLIVAYGLYKNPGISVQEAYDAVKKRSKWIGPNMNLIMQLQEFRNGLLRANGHSQGYKAGVPRRLSPNPMGSRNKDQSSFDADSSGSRTPATAPLPPDYGPDPAPQRASTGNMIPISPGPTSAPSGLDWTTPGFRHTWGASLVPIGSPIEQPFVDPKGYVIPVVTIQHQPRSTPEPEREERFEKEKGRSDSDATVRQIPNFSRQFAIRQQNDDHDDYTSNIPTLNVMESTTSAGHQQKALDRLTSAAPAHHNLQISNEPAPALNARKSSLQERRQNKMKQLAEPFAPRALESQVDSTHLKPFQMDNSLPLASPLKANFSFNDPPRQVRPNDSVISMFDRHKESRSLPLASNASGIPEPLASPRSEGFHMAAVATKDEGDVDYALLSPTRFEFPKNPFDGPEPETQTQASISKPGVSPGLPPRVHAILPPVTEVDSPEQSPFQGFGFLGSQPSPRPTTPPQVSKTAYPPSEEPSPMAGIRRARTDGPEPSPRRLREQDGHLSTTEPKLRPKYSNPDLHSQRRLRAFQNEMEAKLPSHSNSLASNEAATLMSPRAHEFTQNPFHLTLEEALGSPPPVHNGRVLEQEVLGKSLEVQRCTTPHPMDIDPRSPPQSGVSPITRNIWDVL